MDRSMAMNCLKTCSLMQALRYRLQMRELLLKGAEIVCESCLPLIPKVLVYLIDYVRKLGFCLSPNYFPDCRPK